MAELVLKIDAGSSYDDGDILCAFNERAIQCVHAQHICHPWVGGVSSHGLRLGNSLVEDFFLLTHEYKFEVVSETELLRTNLLTNATDLFSDQPNDKGEHIDVREFVARRMKEKAPDGGPRLAIFGERGREVWYGGKIDFSPPKVSALWNAIETRTPNRRNQPQFTKWPLGHQDKKSHFAVPVKEFDDQTAEEYTRSIMDETDQERPQIVKKREHDVPWRPLLAQLQVSENDVRDKLKEIDVRDRPPLPRQAIVHRKERGIV